MNKAVVAALSFVLITGSAMAADLPSYKAPPPPLPSWTGFYVGLNAGGTWSSSNSIWLGSSPIWVTGDNPGPNLSSPTDYSLTAALGASGVITSGNAGGFIGGGQIGYNWQFGFGGNSLVYGVEADIQGIANGGGHNGSWTTIPVSRIRSQEPGLLGHRARANRLSFHPNASRLRDRRFGLRRRQFERQWLPERSSYGCCLAHNWFWRRLIFRCARRMDGRRRPGVDVHAELERQN